MPEHRLSPEQALAAMSIFLKHYRYRTGDGDLSALLGDIQINPRDGRPFDLAAWLDWMEAVEQALEQGEELIGTRR